MGASLTVEAALVLPLFVFFGLAVLAPMRWLDTQRKMQTIIELFCEELSQYAYVAELGGWDSKSQEPGEQETEMQGSAVQVQEGKGLDEEDDIGEGGYGSMFSDAAAGLWLQAQMGSYTDSIRIVRSEVPDEEGDITFELEYDEKIPFFLDEISDVTMRVAVKRRCWMGLRGKLKGQTVDGTMTGEQREMVYITSEGERYHSYRDCICLLNVCEAVSIWEIEHLRNRDGKIFYPCELCTKGEQVQDIVYITPWGIRYHNDRNCSAVAHYFRKVPLEEAAYLGECAFCARREDGD